MTEPHLGALTKHLIPVQLVGTDQYGNDSVIGNFEGGLALNGASLQDIKTNAIIAVLSMTDRGWVVKGKKYRYLFMQVMPRD